MKGWSSPAFLRLLLTLLLLTMASAARHLLEGAAGAHGCATLDPNEPHCPPPTD
ncbi:hypothetical protein BS78_08G004600 [Paspalum vaginatum]|nr:hypothetical protein BS78_08G004600 [Paspalum vaginatum]